MIFTEQMCIDAGITLGLPPDKSLDFYHYYNAQGWLYRPEVPITNLRSAMWRWKRNQYKFENDGKVKLFPISGKTCGVSGCRLPAVYKDSSGAYDNYLCKAHLPKSVKEHYA